MLIRNYPVALSLHMKSCKDSDINQLRDIFVQEDDFQSQAYLRISEAYESDVSDFNNQMKFCSFMP